MYSQLPPATWYFPIILLHFGFGGPLAWVPSNKRQDWPANLFRESSPTCPTTEKPIPNDILPLVNPAVVLVSAQLRAFQLHVRELHDRLAYAKWKVLTPVTERPEIVCLPVSGALNAHRPPPGDKGGYESRAPGLLAPVPPAHADSHPVGWGQRPRADTGKAVLVVDESRRGEIVALTRAELTATPTSLWHSWPQRSDGPPWSVCSIQRHPVRPALSDNLQDRATGPKTGAGRCRGRPPVQFSAIFRATEIRTLYLKK